MTDTESDNAPTAHSWLWLGIALALLPVSNGSLIVPLASWLAPIFLIRFLATQSFGRGAVIAGTGFLAATFVSWWGIFAFLDWLHRLLLRFIYAFDVRCP